MRSLLFALAAVLAATPLLADTVKLKSGAVIRGKVTDRGAYVIVEKDLSASPGAATATASASIRIERQEILTIEMDGAVGRAAQDLDVVVFVNGDELAGRVEIREGGKQVVLVGGQREGGESKGELTFESRQVRTILWSQRAQSDPRGGAAIGTTIQKALDDLRSPDAATAKAGRDKLYAAGVYALPYLEARQLDPDPVVAEAVRRVLEVARLRTYMTPTLAERLPGLPRVLVEAEGPTRVAAIKEALVASAKDCPPILLHLAKNDRSKEVRAFVLGQLMLLDCTKELLELLESQEGSLRFSAAIALGDNGVLVGVPLLIEALKHEELAIRKLAIQKLEQWTGQFYNYFPEAKLEEREKAVATWEAWWAKAGPELTTRSIRSTIKREEITEDEKTEGLAHWANAQILWDKATAAGLEGELRRREMHRTRLALAKSLELYPQNPNARIALAVLWYTELGENGPAKKELDLVLHRYEAEGADRTRLLAHFHLARIAQSEGRFAEAATHYRLALSIDGRNVDALRGEAKNHYDWATAEEKIGVEERLQHFERAGQGFTTALAELDRYELELSENAEAAADGIAHAQPFRRGGFLKSVDAVRLELRRTAADIRFLRGRSYLAMHRPATKERPADGHDARAREDFTAALKLDPDNPLYKQAVKGSETDTWRPVEAPSAPTGTAQPAATPPTGTARPGGKSAAPSK